MALTIYVFSASPGRWEAQDGKTTESKEIILRWSAKNDVAWGFSKSTGRWAKQELSPPAKTAPTLGVNVGAIQCGSTIYAYSGTTGRWDVQRLPDGSEPKLSFGTDWIVVKQGADVYTFAGSTGRWTSPGKADSKDAAAEGESAGVPELRAFQLKYVDCDQADFAVRNLLSADSKDGEFRIVVDKVNHRLLVRGSGTARPR